MTEALRGEGDVVQGDELCVRDPGGNDRVTVAGNDADHSPPEDPDALDRLLAPVADALFAAAKLRAGDAVLDIGCGCGATTLAAGRAVGDAGSASGIDVTPPMLEIARARLRSSGLTNVAFVEADAQTHASPIAYDVGLSRFGTMFFDDPTAAFLNIRRALRPGGRLCLATWQPLEANAWLVIPGAALLHWISLPESDGDGRGMFAQSDPAVVTATLQNAGYSNVDVAPVRLALPLGSDAADATERLADTGVGRAALDAVPDDQRPAAKAAVRAALAEHAGVDGVRLGAAVLITTANVPAETSRNASSLAPRRAD
jgi:SAM-dependent methyltransferase